MIIARSWKDFHDCWFSLLKPKGWVANGRELVSTVECAWRPSQPRVLPRRSKQSSPSSHALSDSLVHFI